MAKQYPNRSDLRNAGGKVAKKVATGQTYGEATKQMAAQSAMPIASAPTDAPPAPSPIQPGQLGAFNRPTERPTEPVTAGASFGAGPTPRTQFAVPVNDPVLTELRALYSAYPSTELADMLDSYVREGY
jgi:hypothetical protein